MRTQEVEAETSSGVNAPASAGNGGNHKVADKEKSGWAKKSETPPGKKRSLLKVKPQKSSGKTAAETKKKPAPKKNIKKKTSAVKEPKTAAKRVAAAKKKTAPAVVSAAVPEAAPAPVQNSVRPVAAPAPQPVSDSAPVRPAENPPVVNKTSASSAGAPSDNRPAENHAASQSSAAPALSVNAPQQSGDNSARKRRRRHRHKKHGNNAENANSQPTANDNNSNGPRPAVNGNPAAAGNSSRPAEMTAQPARYGDMAAPESSPVTVVPAAPAAAQPQTPAGNPQSLPQPVNGEGGGRKKRRRHRHKKKHGGMGENSVSPANGNNASEGGRGAEEVSSAWPNRNDDLETLALYVDTESIPGRKFLRDALVATDRPAENAPAAASKSVREKAVPATGVRQATGRKMLINVVDAGQARVAIVGRDGLEELHIEKDGGRFVHGNIFKGRVDGVQPNLQAAFVNIGGEKNAFLHVADVVPPYGGFEEILGRRRKKNPTDTRDMRIEDMLVEGQEVLVQITREALVTKGPSVTTFLSVPGRYLVAMPNSTMRGVSKKITDDGERRELKKALEQLAPPQNMGYIIRTAGMGKGTEELQLDLDALNRLWQVIGDRAKKVPAPAVLYQENDLVIRTIRDDFRDDIDELVIDSPTDYARAMEFVNAMMPDFAGRIKLYDKKTPLFHAYGIEEKINNLFNRSVKLKSGGEILIEQTEAMVTIDVNTGKMAQAESTREMILQANLEAAEAIAREIRLRDLGGLVMIDFIDMETAEDRKAVEQTLRRATRNDPSRITILPISQLGVLEMTRQRLRQSLHHTHYRTCPYCAGAGMYKRPESLGIEFLRRLRTEFEKNNVRQVKATFNPHTAFDMANEFRSQLAAIEQEYHKKVVLATDESFALDKYVLTDETRVS